MCVLICRRTREQRRWTWQHDVRAAAAKCFHNIMNFATTIQDTNTPQEHTCKRGLGKGNGTLQKKTAGKCVCVTSCVWHVHLPAMLVQIDRLKSKKRHQALPLSARNQYCWDDNMIPILLHSHTVRAHTFKPEPAANWSSSQRTVLSNSAKYCLLLREPSSLSHSNVSVHRPSSTMMTPSAPAS